MIYDIGIIGTGVAGSFASYKLSKDYPDAKVIVFELGRPPIKRRSQICGFLGCLPNSDGKLFLNDINKVSNISNLKKVKSNYNDFKKIINNTVNLFTIVKDNGLYSSLENKIRKEGYDIILNNYIQIYPKDIHVLAKYFAGYYDNNKNMKCYFDTEVKQITKKDSVFSIFANNQEHKCKKLIFSVGRNGWCWAKEVFSNFGIINNNDIAKFGIRVEMNSELLKEFNNSTCSLYKDDLEIGPFLWNGTIIPEDHGELGISAVRSNENRWKTDKVSFLLIGNKKYINKGFEQTDRIARITYILTNDRIAKEKITTLLSGRSKIAVLPEYNWLSESVKEISNIIPDIINKAYFHIPTITPIAPKIKLTHNFESEIENLFVVGESAGITGLLSAALMGLIVVDNISIS